LSEEKDRRVKASFDTQELTASLSGLEKCAGEHTPSSRLAAATSAQLNIDLAAILTSARSRSAPQAAAVEDAAQLTNNPPPNQSSQSTTVDLVPEEELGASAADKVNAPSPPYRRLLVAPAILIVVGSLVGGAGCYMGVQALVALQAPPALQKFDPPLETTAQAPAAEQTADGGSTVAEAAAVMPPSTAKTQAAVEPLTPAAAPPKPEAPVAKLTKPVKERKKPSADKSKKHEPRSNRDATSKPARIAKRHEAPGAPAPPAMANAEPAVVSDARRAAQKITGALKGLVDVDSRALR
jgi:hypothetical protein